MAKEEGGKGQAELGWARSEEDEGRTQDRAGARNEIQLGGGAERRPHKRLAEEDEKEERAQADTNKGAEGRRDPRHRPPIREGAEGGREAWHRPPIKEGAEGRPHGTTTNRPPIKGEGGGETGRQETAPHTGRGMFGYRFKVGS